MCASPEAEPSPDRDLVLTRLIDAPRESVYRAWTDPDLLKQWFAPLPYTTPVAELDVRPGGANLIVMRDPQGNEFPNRGVYLEVVENERLIFTDAYTTAWEPQASPTPNSHPPREPHTPNRLQVRTCGQLHILCGTLERMHQSVWAR